jgi:hypothetical protein
VDRSAENAATIADTLERAAAKAVEHRARGERVAALAP